MRWCRWKLAGRTGSALRFVEVHCPDETEHRRRLESRVRGIEGFPEPTWEDVRQRRAGFQDWVDERLRLDSTASRQHNLQAALDYLTR